MHPIIANCFLLANTVGTIHRNCFNSILLKNYLLVVPDDAPQSVGIVAINSTALQLSWSRPSISNGVIVTYHIAYNRSASEEGNITVDANITAVVVAGLEEYTMYKFVLRASTRIGYGPSTVIFGRTNESCKQKKISHFDNPHPHFAQQIHILLHEMCKCSVLESGLYMHLGSLP